MCGCAAAIARAVVDFLDAVLVACFRSWFRPGPVAAHRVRENPTSLALPPPPTALRVEPLDPGFGSWQLPAKRR
jgi:hypothetical protein